MSSLPLTAGSRARYCTAYARLREVEGRGAGGDAELFALPYLRRGPLAGQWKVRSRTYDRFVAAVLVPLERRGSRPLRILDLGAGNGWLCYRMALRGHSAVALDFRTDPVDGLSAAEAYPAVLPRMFGRVAGDFAALPLSRHAFDLALFNASLHYAEDLPSVLGEAARSVRPGGRLVILDSPFYRRSEAGEAMVREKREQTRRRHGDLAEDLLALRPIEYLTRESLRAAASPFGLRFRRRRVSYPFAYEWRPVVAALRGRRAPSRFDLWEADVP